MSKWTRVLNEIKKHPMNEKDDKIFLRFLKWQLFEKKNDEKIVDWIDDAKLIVKQGYTVSTGNYYFGLFEYVEMMFVLNYLDKEDVFVDVGANIGDYSILSAKCCGANAIAFEPMPNVYDFMKRQIELNDINDKVQMYQMGLSNEKGVLKFTNEDAVSHAVLDNKMEPNLIEVPVGTLDDVLDSRPINIVKIDVEGLEYHVLQGAKKSIMQSECNVVMAECNGLCSRYNINENDIINLLSECGFAPYYYDVDKNECKKLDNIDSKNVIFIKDLEFTNEKLKKSKRHMFNGNML